MIPKEAAGVIVPSGELLVDRLLPEHAEGDYYFDGRFYQTVDESEYGRRQQLAGDYAEGTTREMSVEAYQQWVELDWKRPHGTHKAVERLGRKLQEEAIETLDALYEAAYAPNDESLHQAAISELGDTLWTVTAMASNAGVNTDRALQSRLWGDGLLSHRVSGITLEDIDTLINEGLTPYLVHQPAASTAGDAEPIMHEEMEPQQNLAFRTLGLAQVCERQFAHGDGPFTVGYHQKIGKETIAPMVADHVLLIAWYAKHWLGSSLSEVVKINVPKLRQRVALNLVDKADGTRVKAS